MNMNFITDNFNRGQILMMIVSVGLIVYHVEWFLNYFQS